MLLSAAGMQAAGLFAPAAGAKNQATGLLGLGTQPVKIDDAVPKNMNVKSQTSNASGIGIMPSSNYVDCLPANTSLRDEYADALAAYEKCSASGQCQMAPPKRSIRSLEQYGPGNPIYEQYKACAIKNNQKPATILYGR